METPQIYDFLRRRYVTLTPEESVRQQFCHYLVEQLGYPEGLLGNEIMVNVGGVSRRCDTMLYRAGTALPHMIVEYKAPTVQITESVFTQILSYNSILRADYLVVTNGTATYCCRMDYEQQTHQFLPCVPPYADLK